MKLAFEDGVKIDNGIWRIRILPEQAKIFGRPKHEGSRITVIIGANGFVSGKNGIQIDVEGSTLLSLGDTEDAIVILESSQQIEKKSSISGDDQFRHLVRQELSGKAAQAAELLLKAIRERFPGDLKRGLRNNFSETPDNFWYVIVQPRNQSLSITIRGKKEDFRSKTVELKDDRPGYTRFALSDPALVSEALRLIIESRR